MSAEPFVSRAKALPAKRSEKGYGDENELNSIELFVNNGPRFDIQIPDLVSNTTLGSIKLCRLEF